MDKMYIYTFEQEQTDIRFKKAMFDYLKMFFVATFILVTFILFSGCAQAETIVIKTLKASWYSNASLNKEGTWKHGEQRMANGERFNENALTCASRQYPLGTMVRVKNVDNGKSVVCKVTDRIGKRFAKTRIDMSRGAFSKISSLDKGLINVIVKEI